MKIKSIVFLQLCTYLFKNLNLKNKNKTNFLNSALEMIIYNKY